MDVGSLIQLSCARSCPSSSAEWLLSDRITALLRQALLTSSGQRQMERVGGGMEGWREEKLSSMSMTRTEINIPSNFLEKAKKMLVINTKNWIEDVA